MKQLAPSLKYIAEIIEKGVILMLKVWEIPKH
jgi:hypothetical protein